MSTTPKTTALVAGAQPKTINPLLAAYLQRLATKPLQTKMITSGFLSFLQEVTASHLAGTPSPLATSKSGPTADIQNALAAAKIDSMAFKMGFYGAFISAPINHVLIGTLQSAFAGKTTTKDKLLQLLVGNLLIAPTTTVVYLSYMAIIGGARSIEGIKKVIKTGFGPMIKISAVANPLATILAQTFLPVELWVPFFNAVSFVLGTFFNTKLKLAKLAAARKANKDKRIGGGEKKGPVA